MEGRVKKVFVLSVRRVSAPASWAAIPAGHGDDES